MSFRLVRSLCLLCALVGGASHHAAAQDNTYAGRPGLAGPEETPAENASCDSLAATLGGFEVPAGDRIDLWASGPLTLIHTDEVLWYIAICSAPGIRVMCVTYSDNDMKVGERILVRGAMQIQDETHIVLDPCLASRD
ncbi:MAG: hypothetical protein ACRECW_12385 [Phyllobacterium sp.]